MSTVIPSDIASPKTANQLRDIFSLALVLLALLLLRDVDILEFFRILGIWQLSREVVSGEKKMIRV
jgi:hypothetical protein